MKNSSPQKRSLFVTFAIYIFVIILVPSIILILYFRHVAISDMREKAQENAEYYVSQTQGSVEEALNICKSLSGNVQLDYAIQQYMSSDDNTYLSAARNSLRDITGNPRLFLISKSLDYINDVAIFRNDGASISYMPAGLTSSAVRQMRSDYEIVKGNDVQNTFLTIDIDPDAFLYLSNYSNLNTMKKRGYLLVRLDPENIINADSLTKVYPHAEISLTRKDGSVLYQNDDSYQMRPSDYVIHKQIDDSDMDLSICIPSGSLYREVNKVSIIYLLVVFSIIGCAYLFSTLLILQIKKEILKIQDSILDMANSGYQMNVPESQYIEFSQISHAFNQLAKQLRQSLKATYEKGIELQKSQSYLLTAQINPHFIFNVLETINMKCINAGQRDISTMVTNLSKLLRGNIGGSADFKVTIEKELEYVKYYLTLQKERFGDKLSWDIEYDDESTLQYRIPRLTIQPLVENAISHGLEPKPDMGWVRIRIWEEDNLYITVEDNGIGFDVYKMKSGQTSGHGNQIAIRNIEQRLSLAYQERVSLTFVSEIQKGTTVRIIIPMEADTHV